MSRCRPVTYGRGPEATITPKPTPNQAPTNKRILVIGGGVIGLVTSWLLLDQGHQVTILAHDWSDLKKGVKLPSQVAGALWEYPPGGCGMTEIQAPGNAHSTLEDYRKWAVESFDVYHQMAVADGGKDAEAFGLHIRSLDMCLLNPVTHEDHRDKFEGIKRESEKQPHLWRLKVYNTEPELEKKLKQIGVVKEYDTGIVTVYEHLAPTIDSEKGMERLMELVQMKGARMVTRELQGDLLDQEIALRHEFKADAIVNASGLGSVELASDCQVFPVRGGVLRVRNEVHGHFTGLDRSLLLPAQHNKDDAIADVVYIVPRSDETIVLGSIIHSEECTDLLIDDPAVQGVRHRCTSFLPMLKDARLCEENPFAQGLRPFSHLNVRVEREGRKGPRGSRIIHNYGHGGSGWTLAFGCAADCVSLVEEVLGEEPE
ncbi:hypothetical protein BDZ91DRAFT_668744 [Kalaharituber pfeilii]|nr:hypothetical protein BDZ91DRAFT_668744 [Kalaharituber pfeilii]